MAQDQQYEIKSAYVIPVLRGADGQDRVLFLVRKGEVLSSDGRQLYPAGMLDLPGGTFDDEDGAGKTTRECAKEIAIRELQEETGLTVAVERLRDGPLLLSIDGKAVVYFVLNISEEEFGSIIVSDEHTGVELADMHEIFWGTGKRIFDAHGDAVAIALAENGFVLVKEGRDIIPCWRDGTFTRRSGEGLDEAVFRYIRNS